MRCVACEGSPLNLNYHATDTKGRGFDYFTCPSCGTVQLANVSDSILTYAYHDTDYYGGEKEKFKWPFSWLFNLAKKLSARKVANMMANPEATVLDVGCGTGSFLQALGKLGYTKLWGNEIRSPRNPCPKITWIEGKFSSLHLPHQKFDLITLFHVFEHLQEPRQVISRLNHLVQIDGKVILSLPNIESRQSKTYGAQWFHLDPPRHLHLIPPSTLKAHFSECGFELVSESYHSLLYNPFGYLQSWLNQRTEQRDMLYEFLKQGGRTRGLRSKLILAASLGFAILSFTVFCLIDRSECRHKQSGTVEFVFRKYREHSASSQTKRKEADESLH